MRDDNELYMLGTLSSDMHNAVTMCPELNLCFAKHVQSTFPVGPGAALLEMGILAMERLLDNDSDEDAISTRTRQVIRDEATRLINNYGYDSRVAGLAMAIQEWMSLPAAQGFILKMAASVESYNPWYVLKRSMAAIKNES